MANIDVCLSLKDVIELVQDHYKNDVVDSLNIYLPTCDIILPYKATTTGNITIHGGINRTSPSVTINSQHLSTIWKENEDKNWDCW